MNFKSEDVEIDCKVKRDVVFRQECLASCKNGKRLAIGGSKRAIRHDPGKKFFHQANNDWST